MDINSTFQDETEKNGTVILPNIDTGQVAINIIYMITGCSAAISNFIVIVLISLCKNLRRKELFILLGLATGDVIYGIGFFIGGIRRLFLVLHNEHTSYVSPWTCQLVPATFFYVFGSQMSAMMNVAISADRLMSVAFLHVYQSLSFRYVFRVTSGVIFLAAISYFTGFILSSTMPRTPTVLAICLSTQSSWPSYGVFYTCFAAVCNSTSILVYCFVMGVLKFRLKNSSGVVHDIQQKRQIKVTKMIAITSFTDFVLDVIPWCIVIYVNTAHLSDSVSEIVAPVSYIVIQCKRTLTVAIYMWKLKDLRRAFLNMLHCKLKGIQQIAPHITNTANVSRFNNVAKHETGF